MNEKKTLFLFLGFKAFLEDLFSKNGRKYLQKAFIFGKIYYEFKKGDFLCLILKVQKKL